MTAGELLAAYDAQLRARSDFEGRVRNISRVRSGRPYVHLQVLRHARPDNGGFLSEWVPFGKSKIWKGEEPLDDPFPKPERVFFDKAEPDDGTSEIYPGEALVAERVYCFPGRDVLLHVGLKVRLRSIWAWLFADPTDKREPWEDEGHSQTTTRWILKPLPKAEASPILGGRGRRT